MSKIKESYSCKCGAESYEEHVAKVEAGAYGGHTFQITIRQEKIA